MKTMPLKILGISGSLKATSANKKILQFISTFLPANAEFILYNDLSLLPHYNPDIDVPNTIDCVEQLRLIVKECQVVIICTPEYAFGVPGALKNALDWLVSSGEMNENKVVVITASLGGDKALASLLLTLQALGANVLSSLNIPFINSKISKDGVVDSATKLQIQQVVAAILV